MSGANYIYFGKDKENPQDPKHTGITCVNYTINDATNVLTFAVAFCSPENDFVKKKARLIASGRLEKGDKVESVIVERVAEGHALVHEAVCTAITTGMQRESEKWHQGTVAGVKIPRWFNKEQVK